MNEENRKKFEKLHKALNEVTTWPTVYMFKFIVPADNKRYAQVEAPFGPEAEIRKRPSSKGNFTAFSVKEVMLSADDIMHVYMRASEIEGCISL